MSIIDNQDAEWFTHRTFGVPCVARGHDKLCEWELTWSTHPAGGKDAWLRVPNNLVYELEDLR